jgi:hypothetical protein
MSVEKAKGMTDQERDTSEWVVEKRMSNLDSNSRRKLERNYIQYISLTSSS